MAIMRHKYAYKTSSRRQVEKNNVFFMYVFKVIFFFFFVKTHSFLKRRYNFALLMGRNFVYAHAYSRHLSFSLI